MSGADLDVLLVNVNTEFKKVVDYFRFLKLALHPEKTKFILFTNSTDARNRDVSIQLNFNNDNTNIINDTMFITHFCTHILFMGFKFGAPLQIQT